jgi:hypothetical protein
MKQMIVIYLATQGIQRIGGRGGQGWGVGVGWRGGGGVEPTTKNLTSSHRHCLRLWAGPIYRPILLVSADLIQPILIIIGVSHVRKIDTKDTNLWCRPY